MNKNSIIGTVLICLLFMGYMYVSQPSPEQIEAQRRYNDSIQQAQREAIVENAAQDELTKLKSDSAVIAPMDSAAIAAQDSIQNLRLIQTYGNLSSATKGEEQIVTIENDVLSLQISTKGGQIKAATLKQYDDYHWTFVNEPEYKLFPGDNLSAVRLEIEADIEYIVVEGAMQYYRASGDDRWLRRVLPALEKGIDYLTSDPKRWDAERGLVKRGYTIDTWDFLNIPDAGTNRKIEDGTPMADMHGDNSGAYQAMMQLAWMNERFGHRKKAAEWRKRAESLRENMFRHLWNGRFFVHQLPLNCAPIDGAEASRLSLSNTYDMNRGVTDLGQSRSIIEEYMVRRDTTSAFAEWFSIDPPYDRFGGYKAGRYVNGGISPFTAGELAKAALSNGYESFGWDIIERMMEMVARDGAIYFLYSPSERKPMGGGPSAWGAAAFISAVDEGLAGIVDTGSKYSSISFSPRFPVSGYRELRYTTGYEISGVLVDLRYVLTGNGLRYRLSSPARHIDAHIYIPEGVKVDHVRCNQKSVSYKEVLVGDSRYVDFKVDGTSGVADIEVVFGSDPE